MRGNRNFGRYLTAVIIIVVSVVAKAALDERDETAPTLNSILEKNAAKLDHGWAFLIGATPEGKDCFVTWDYFNDQALSLRVADGRVASSYAMGQKYEDGVPHKNVLILAKTGGRHGRLRDEFAFDNQVGVRWFSGTDIRTIRLSFNEFGRIQEAFGDIEALDSGDERVLCKFPSVSF